VSQLKVCCKRKSVVPRVGVLNEEQYSLNSINRFELPAVHFSILMEWNENHCRKKMSSDDADRYPEVAPYDTGMLAVSDVHTMYYEQVGNPTGSPVLFLHGGPGGGTGMGDRRYFDPSFYRVILIHQRGAGKSTRLLVSRTTPLGI
jgi:hypothetical protein